MRTGYIYCHTAPNGKMYIGQTISDPPYYRWSGKKRYKDSAFESAINKYGWENFTHKILCSVKKETKHELIQELNKLECMYIKSYNTMSPNGYNLQCGGNSSSPTKETIEKIRASCKKYKPTLEARKKQSIAQKGRVQKKETCEKISRTLTGRKMSQEFCEKCRLSKLGNTNHKGIYKHKISEEILNNIIFDYKSGVKKMKLMNKYNISYRHITNIIKEIKEG